MSAPQRTAISALALSAAGLVAIAQYEGYRGAAYDDGVGVQTIGFGTTRGVQKGDRIDPVRALQRLNADAAIFERQLALCIHVPLYQHEWDAYVSWAYNVGAAAACKSTLIKKLNRGDYVGACNELPRWNRAGGRVLPGLVKRRQAEKNTCLGVSK